TTREQNKKNANFIKIILKGKEGNTTATGAKIELWSNGKYQFMENFLTRGYASCVDPVLHFGLGNARLVDSVKVIWPSTGYISILNNIQVNQIITFNESDAKPENNRTDPDFNKLLFVKCDTVIDYTHQQEDFIDFFLNQNIIPHKFSQIGPCLTKGDLNNDGRIDLITGSTNILPTTVLINSGEKFNSVNVEGLSTQKKFTESDIAIVDIDKDGMNDVVAVAGGYENQSENEYKHYLYKNVNGIFKATELPVPPFIASVIRLCDFNHDGMQDVFIGARVKKGKFPYSNYSWLLVNKNGNLTADSSLRFDAGMVTDALWTDFDNDGWEDLMIAREWNSILLLKNLNGQKFVAQNKNGFEKYHGIWYCIAGGDFDNDGDQDYIAGNLGENHRFTVSAKYPLNLYAVDLELDGNIDPIIAAFWEDKNGKMTEYPVNYMDELCAQSQYIRTLFPDYATFSYSTLSTIINKEIARRIEFKLYVNTTSTYFVRNDKGKFKFIRMPDPVQVSPIKKIIIK
ncbi:MAG: FG-GAP-like repeat-containing protein, partial [Bacteroidales bacterium]